MTVTNPRQPRWSNAQHTSIDLIVTIDGMDAPHTVLKGSDLFTRAAAGEYGLVSGYLEAAPSKEALRRLADIKCDAVAAAGISVTLSDGRVALADTNVAGRAAILALRGESEAGPVTWYQSTGPLTLSAADVRQIQAAIDDYFHGALATWMALRAAIDAGAVTTHAQIETPPAPIPAWPA